MSYIENTILRVLKGLLIIITVLGAASLLYGYLFGYYDDPRTTTEISVIWDVTEKHEPHPTAEEILPCFGLDANANNGAIFRFTYASDVSLNRETVFSLTPAGSNALTNQFDRKREVDKFSGQVTAFLNSLVIDTAIGRQHSSVYMPIAESVNKLVADKSADKKILLVYSDLRENTLGLSFYDKKTVALQKSDPDKIRDMLFASVPLGDLTGVEVHFLYEPSDPADDGAYRIISGFYKTLFESKGATVFVSANLAE